MRVLAQSLSESLPSLACRGPLVTVPFLSVFSDSFPQKESWRINCHTGPSCLCGGEKLLQHTSVWRPGEQETQPRQAGTERQTPFRRSCASLFCCCSAFPDKRGLGHRDIGIFVLLLLCH